MLYFWIRQTYGTFHVIFLNQADVWDISCYIFESGRRMGHFMLYFWIRQTYGTFHIIFLNQADVWDISYYIFESGRRMGHFILYFWIRQTYGTFHVIFLKVVLPQFIVWIRMKHCTIIIVAITIPSCITYAVDAVLLNKSRRINTRRFVFLPFCLVIRKFPELVPPLCLYVSSLSSYLLYVYT
jgi:hypothetical protein